MRQRTALRVRRIAMALAAALAVPAAARAQDESPAMALVREGFRLREQGDLRGAIARFERAVALDSVATQPRLSLAYALLAAERVPEAIAQFERIVRTDPALVLAHRQLGYLYGARGEPARAIAAFQAADALHGLTPTDWLTLGDLHARQGDGTRARAAYETARATGDDGQRARAASALAGLAGGSAVPPVQGGPNAPATATSVPAPRATASTFLETYASPLYQRRFALVTGQGVARLGVLLPGSWRTTPYASLRLSTDSRSESGAAPLIYSENSLIPAAGLRVQPFGARVTLYGEVGAAFPVIDDNRGRGPRKDVRAGAYTFGGWPHGTLPGASARSPRTVRGELYADANYLSRFDDDVFASAQWREIADVWRVNGRGVELFARGSVVRDRRGLYWANVAELGGGLTIVPTRSRRAALYLEQTAGTHLRELPANGRRGYADTRVMLVLYRYAALARGRR